MAGVHSSYIDYNMAGDKGKHTGGDQMRKWAFWGQWGAALLVAVGIGIELAMRAPIGFIFITAGSLIFALATKYKRRV